MNACTDVFTIVLRLTRKLVNASREKPVAFSTTSHGGKISSARVVQGCPASIKGSSILFNGYFPTMLDGRATVSYMDELHGRATTSYMDIGILFNFVLRTEVYAEWCPRS